MISNWDSFNESINVEPTQDQLETLQLIMDIFQDFQDEIDFKLRYQIIIRSGPYNIAYNIKGKYEDQWMADGKIHIRYMVKLISKYHEKDDILLDCIERTESFGFKSIKNPHWIVFYYEDENINESKSTRPNPTEEQLNNLKTLKDIFQEFEDEVDFDLYYSVSIPDDSWIGDEPKRSIFDIDGDYMQTFAPKINVKRIPYYTVEISSDHSKSDILNSCIKMAKSMGFELNDRYKNDHWLTFSMEDDTIS